MANLFGFGSPESGRRRSQDDMLAKISSNVEVVVETLESLTERVARMEKREERRDEARESVHRTTHEKESSLVSVSTGGGCATFPYAASRTTFRIACQRRRWIPCATSRTSRG